MTTVKLLMVDDEFDQRELLAGYLARHGFHVVQAGNGEEALASYRSVFAPVALVDMKMPGMSGLELLNRLREINPFVQVIVLTAFGSVENAVEAMRAGAFDYLTKPVDNLEELLVKLNRAAEHNRLIVEHGILKERLAEVFPDSELIGDSEGMKQVRRLIATVAPQEASVLITGQSGTGKELVARAIHALSPRASQRLVAINCAAFPETLLESELFGYEKGAFTGAELTKQGRFELADGGTLFLDEIGEMPPAMQVKLLRVLEERKIQRLGAVTEIPLDIRLITATNRDLDAMIKSGEFREDLFYRLNVIGIHLPPLKERAGDILLLARQFLERYARKLGKPIDGIDPEAAALLSSYDWPGNVRELENVIERAVVLAGSKAITPHELPGLSPSGPAAVSGQVQSLAEVEKETIRNCLLQMNWNLTASAEKLGIHRNTLRAKIKEYHLKP